jgi:hypothetical protein
MVVLHTQASNRTKRVSVDGHSKELGLPKKGVVCKSFDSTCGWKDIAGE